MLTNILSYGAGTLIAIVLVAVLGYVFIRDITQKKHGVLRNYPVVGHLRYWLIEIGPELRQYIVTSNDEERPFSRDQRRWVYASSKREINTFGFGTDNDLEFTAGYPVEAVANRVLYTGNATNLNN